MKNKNYIIAIDGVAATGKSVLARTISQRLNILYIDTGAMYRAVGMFFIQNNIEINEENVLKNIDNINVKLKYKDDNTLTYLNNIDVSNYIRSEEISMAASAVSKYKQVREKLVALQRNMAIEQSVVLEGRDVSSVVFPQADLKIFLTASVDVRALRRQKDLKETNQIVDLETIKKALQKRDEQDITRDESPLIKVNDAIEIDTTNLSKVQTVELVIELLNERIGLI
ncbi:MAG: (d)CMP kinase [Clostridia bacterium]